MKLASANIQGQVPDYRRFDGCAIERVVPGNEGAKGLLIGIEFDQTNDPGRDTALFTSAFFYSPAFFTNVTRISKNLRQKIYLPN